VQNVADAAALAAAKKLIQDKNSDGVAEVYCAEAIQAAIDYAKQNTSFGLTSPINITAADVTIGKWNLATKQFDTTGCTDGTTTPIQVNAVQVSVNRAGGEGGNSQVSTFFGNVLGVGTQETDPDTLIKTGPAKLSVAASSVAMLGLAGTSSADLPFAISYQYTSGDGSASNGFQRMLDKFAPAPAIAALPRTYQWKDLGGYNPLDATRATFAVPKQSEQSNTYLVKYLKGPGITGGLVFPQKKVGDQLWPMSEWYWGTIVKPTFQALKDRWQYELANPKSIKVNGNWRVTLPVYKSTAVTSALPPNSWFKLASLLVPGVPQAYACTAYSPAVYTHGFATVDIVKVEVPACNTSTNQVTDPNSCRNKCYVEIIPVNNNTLSTDKGSNPIPYQKDYKDMNPVANKVGVFAAAPRLVK
jgi:hypothetical protein